MHTAFFNSIQVVVLQSAQKVTSIIERTMGISFMGFFSSFFNSWSKCGTDWTQPTHKYPQMDVIRISTSYGFEPQ